MYDWLIVGAASPAACSRNVSRANATSASSSSTAARTSAAMPTTATTMPAC